jgi:hypothetical protein
MFYLNGWSIATKQMIRANEATFDSNTSIMDMVQEFVDVSTLNTSYTY